MAGKRPVFTENSSANLTTIETFLGSEGRAAYQQLLDRLFEKTIPILCRFPRTGRSFLRHAIKSSKAKALTGELGLMLRKGDDLRECVMDDHLVLYLIRHDRIIFIAIKHHRQLSFDLKHFWQRDN